jgi:peptidoglycan-associated lipoprotein
MKTQYKLILLSFLLGLASSCASMHKNPPPPPVAESEPIEASAPVEITPVVEASAPVMVAPAPVVKNYSENVVFFAFDKYSVEDNYTDLLKFNSQFLKSNSKAHITLIGNTDKVGSVEYNLALGQRRANSLRKMLIAHGVKKSQIETVSLGKAKRKFSGEDEGKNRRVDIIYKSDAPEGYSMNESGLPQVDTSSMTANSNNMNNDVNMNNEAVSSNAPTVGSSI